MASKYINDVPPEVDRRCVTDRLCSSIEDVVPGRCIIVPTKLDLLLPVSLLPAAGRLESGEGVVKPTKLLCRELELLPVVLTKLLFPEPGLLPEFVPGRLEGGETNDGNFAEVPKADLTECVNDDFVDKMLLESGLSFSVKYSNGVRSNCGLPFVAIVNFVSPKISAFVRFFVESND